MNTRWKEGKFRTVPLKDLHVAAYAEIGGEPLMLNRFVLADTRGEDSVLHLDGGAVHLWARLSRHDHEVLSMQSQFRFEKLNLDQLVHAFDANAAPVPGQIAGSATLLYDTAAGSNSGAAARPSTGPATRSATQAVLEHFIRNVYAQANINLTRSNLGNTAVVSFLYNAMNLGRDVGRPNGNGSVAMHLENGTLDVTRMDYFNRGTEVHAIAQISDLWKLQDSPVRGSAVGSARPLRSLKLPFIADLDQILGVLQSELTTVNIGGTLHKPDIQPLPFRFVGDSMRSLILGDVRGDNDATVAE